MKAVADLATALDLAKLKAAAVLDPDQLEDVEDIAERVDERRGSVADSFVVALAGGTGTGKSSLLNALAGEDVASVSAVRPHTDQPLALIPSDPSFELIAFLDDMGIAERATQDRFADLAIIDLPDQDSIALAHRQLVWELLPEVDSIAWVVDPDKYRDATFLRDYVGGLASYQDQALFVLNKSDQLSDEAISEVEADFVGQLEVAGIVEPVVFVVAAAPPHQSPRGVAALGQHLTRQMEAKKVLASKTVADVARAASLLARRAGLERGWALGFEDRWAEAEAAAVGALIAGDADTAVSVFDGFVTALVGQVGPTFGRRLVGAVPPGMIEREVTAATTHVMVPPEVPRRRFRRRTNELARAPYVDYDLGAAIADPLRELLWERAFLGAMLAAVSVQAAQVQARLTR